MASTVADESGFIDRTEEDKGTGFGFFPQAPAPPEDDVVQRALTVLEGRLRLVGPSVTSPQAVKDYLRLRLAGLEHEVFVVLFLDSTTADRYREDVPRHTGFGAPPRSCQGGAEAQRRSSHLRP